MVASRPNDQLSLAASDAAQRHRNRKGLKTKLESKQWCYRLIVSLVQGQPGYYARVLEESPQMGVNR